MTKAPVANPKMMLGAVRGGAVRLAPADKELMIAEGIETSLTVQIMLKKPTWAALSSGNMKQIVLPPLPLAQTLYIAKDNDEAGNKGALALADKAWAEGRTVHILQPPPKINDFNDLLFHGDLG
jgi:DNA primase